MRRILIWHTVGRSGGKGQIVAVVAVQPLPAQFFQFGNSLENAMVLWGLAFRMVTASAQANVDLLLEA